MKLRLINRFCQVIEYGWNHSYLISNQWFSGKKRIFIFFDIIYCYFKYKIWSNQYLKEHFWELKKEQRRKLGVIYHKENKTKESWVDNFYENRKFIERWSKFKIECSPRMRRKRNEAYIKYYNMGKNCIVEYGVELSRQHHLPGNIIVGNNVRLCKKTFIDYSGGVVLHDFVTLCYGTSIETHDHDLELWSKGIEKSIPSTLEIGEGAFIGIHTTILNSCKYIGKYARIGAGAVVTKDIPDYALAVGVPAKVIKYIK